MHQLKGARALERHSRLDEINYFSNNNNIYLAHIYEPKYTVPGRHIAHIYILCLVKPYVCTCTLATACLAPLHTLDQHRHVTDVPTYTGRRTTSPLFIQTESSPLVAIPIAFSCPLEWGRSR